MICNLDSEETICDEMDKCDLRCKHCHIIVTAERLKASDSS